MDFGRPASDFRRSPEFRRDVRLEPQHRSRSQNRVDPEFIPTDYSSYSRPIDKNARSKSLDYRDAFRDDDPYFGERSGAGGRGTTIPVRQEPPRQERNYDYDRDLDSRRNWVDTPRGKEIEIPMERIRTARSSEHLDRWDKRPQYDDRRAPPPQRQSPKSISSSRKPNLNLSFEAARPRRIEPPMEYRRDDYPMRQDNSREIHRGGEHERRGGGYSRYENSYEYQSHGGGGGGYSRGGGHSPRRITQQPQPQHSLSPPNYRSGGGVHDQNGFGFGGPRPVAYRKIRCCCFTFIWPPWSNEPTNPPQQIYRNI